MRNNSSQLAQYEVYAIRYASMPRVRSDNFIGGDPHDGPMPMDFFVWLIKSPERIILVDTGFNAQTASDRNRKLIQCPIDALSALGVTASQISDVVITHLHYDHAGNFDKLPHSKFHIQDAEMEYATGRCMCHAPLRHAYAVEDIVKLVRNVYMDKVIFHDGDATIAPGVSLIKIGGHTKGLQAVRVNTARGWVVLASDASHYYENMHSSRPFPIVYNVADMLDGYNKLLSNADSADHIVPGHDPEVIRCYPQYQGNPDIVSLHIAPS